MNTKEVREALKTRFCPPDWLVVEEFETLPGSRADVIALNVSGERALARSFLGLEIKVSRSDYLHEIKNPEKRASAYAGVDAIFICCPSKMLDPRELPDDLGLIEVSAGGRTRIKRYPVGWVPPLEKVTHPEPYENKLWVGTYPCIHINELPPIPRIVASAFARAFDPQRIDLIRAFKVENQRREIKELKYKLKDAKREVRHEFDRFITKHGGATWATRVIKDSFCV